MYSTLIAQIRFFTNFHFVEEIRKSLRTRNKWMDYNRSSMNTQTRIWGQRPHAYAANLAAASPPTPSQEKSLAHCKSEIWKEADTLIVVRWFLFGSYVATASTLEESCFYKIPQLGRRTHHPRLDSFVHDVQKPPRERAKRAFMPISRFALSPPKDRKVFPKTPKKLGGARYRHTFTDFSQTTKKRLSFFSFQRYQTCNCGVWARKITSI